VIGRRPGTFVEPVHGPVMVIAVRNESSAPARLTIGAYLAN
jgi:hypothetical protein